MHGLERHVLLRIPSVAGIDLSITNEVVLVWVAAAVTFALLTLACRRKSLVARGVFQNLFEAMVQYIDEQIVHGSIGKNAGAWSPFLLTLFFFILFSNLLGLVPLPSHVQAATSTLSVPLALAALVFAVTVGINLRTHGLVGFLRKFVPPGLPKVIAVFAVPIEVVSWLAKPLSLAIRLFANMMAGHALILVFVGLAAQAAWFVAVLPLAGAVIMSGFELFVCLIQAFIFTMLTGAYIREALVAEH